MRQIANGGGNTRRAGDLLFISVNYAESSKTSSLKSAVFIESKCFIDFICTGVILGRNSLVHGSNWSLSNKITGIGDIKSTYGISPTF